MRWFFVCVPGAASRGEPFVLESAAVMMPPPSLFSSVTVLVLWCVAMRSLCTTGSAADVPGVGDRTKELPRPGEVFPVAGRTAFLIPAKDSGKPEKPWVWYAPTLPGLPGNEERFMIDRFLQTGIAVAGIDVGESYGSPEGRRGFDALYAELTAVRGYSRKPVLLGRSRGGLMALSWAAENPDKVGGFAGIYPVCNLESYPGLAKACGAYGMTAQELQARLREHNPVDRLAGLARAAVPLFAIHGDVDTVVPLEANSGRVRERYEALGGSMQLVVVKGQGHNMWSGFFECTELVEFVVRHSGDRAVSARPAAKTTLPANHER
ncbi:MAG: prolyl oligopeptidase family serine peptidase [Verrucomicrobiales bacterium]|nr:prolyl oligopeptidase family serine peptidase [Verrucomicrobiales bacterium]